MILECLVTLCMGNLFAGATEYTYTPEPQQEYAIIDEVELPEEYVVLEPRDNVPERPELLAVAPPPPPPPPPPVSNSQPVGGVWERLAVCESGMGGVPRWDYNGGSGFDGGLQFLPSTWAAFKSEDHASHAYMESPRNQIVVAKRVAAAQGAGAWPSCTSKLGISTEDLLNG